MQTQNYQILLYYGIEDNETECTTFHAFRAVDPKLPHDYSKIAVELAAQLDCKPEDGCFQSRRMYIDLPESLIQRIQHDAIVSVIEKGAEELILTNLAFAAQINSVIHLQSRKEDVVSQIAQRDEPELEDVSDADIAKIAERSDNILSKNDGYFERFWDSINIAIDEYVEQVKVGGKAPIACMEYLSFSGVVMESQKFYEEAALIDALRKGLDIGYPIGVVLYQDAEGKTISRRFLEDLDCMPKYVKEEPYPTLG